MAGAAPSAPAKVAVSEKDKQAAMLEKMEKAEQKKLLKIRENVKQYQHALLDTLTFDSTANKYKVRIKCAKTGDTNRWVYTSDLHQVNMCEAAQADERKVKQAQKRSDEKAAREHLKATTAKPAGK